MKRKLKSVRAVAQKQNLHFPEDVQHHVQYGANVQSMVLYMMHYQLIPFARTKEFFQDFFDLSISEGTYGTSMKNLAPIWRKPLSHKQEIRSSKHPLFILMKRVYEVKEKHNGYIH